MAGYLKLSFGKAVERTLSNFIVILSPFIMLLFAKDEFHLSSSIIFSIMILMNNVKYYVVYSMMGVGFYF